MSINFLFLNSDKKLLSIPYPAFKFNLLFSVLDGSFSLGHYVENESLISEEGSYACLLLILNPFLISYNNSSSISFLSVLDGYLHCALFLLYSFMSYFFPFFEVICSRYWFAHDGNEYYCTLGISLLFSG